MSTADIAALVIFWAPVTMVVLAGIAISVVVTVKLVVDLWKG